MGFASLYWDPLTSAFFFLVKVTEFLVNYLNSEVHQRGGGSDNKMNYKKLLLIENFLSN